MGIRGLLLAGAIAMLALIATRFEFRSDITHFLPSGDAKLSAAISRQLTESELSRSMILSVRGEALANAIDAAARLEAELAGHPELAWIRGGVDRDQMRHLYELYFPRRNYFLSDRPDDPVRGVRSRVDSVSLREHARNLRRQLALPASPLFEQVAVQDPIASFQGILERVQSTDPGLQIRDGRFVSRDGEHAILLLATRSSAFDTSAQAPFLHDLATAFATIRDASGDPSLSLERSGLNRFSVRIEEDIQRDVMWIIGCSFVGVGVLFLLFFRSPAVFGLAALPSAFGILVAGSIGILIFGDLDALTVGFGASLIGVAIDYSIHLMNHSMLAPESESPFTTARRLRPPLIVGAVTTMASFAGLALTSFPGFRQMGFFAITGVAVALLMTLFVLPRLLDRRHAIPARSRRMANRLGRAVTSLERHRGPLWLVPGLTVALSLVAIPGLEWNDDISSLSELDPELLAEDLRVRDQVSQFDASRLVMLTAADEDSAIERNDELALRLEGLIEAGDLEGMRSLHSLLWSPALQRRNLELLRADSGLAARVDASFSEEGFRPGAFAPFGESLEAEPPPPLRLDDLRQSGLADLVRSLVLSSNAKLAGRTTIVTYLRGVLDEAALVRVIDSVPGAALFSQRSFLNEIYAAFRSTTLRQIAVGSVLVIAVLLIRYRRLRPALAAFLPSILTAAILLSLFSIFGVHANLLHVVSLVMVMGMGVDYGVFVVDSGGDAEALGATMLSLLLSCLTTVFVFGTLALSSHPALRAIGLTAGVGIALSFVLAPVTFICLGRGRLETTEEDP